MGKNKFTATLVFCFAMGACLLFFGRGQGGAGEGPLMVEDPWPPYTIGEYGPAAGGIAVEITTEIFYRMGLTPRLELLPWKRVLKMAEAGTVDGIMLLMYTRERESFLIYTDKLFTSVDQVYANTTSKDYPISSLGDLKDYRLGYVYGFFYGDKADKLLFKTARQTSKAYTAEENLGYLADRRVDFIIESRHVVQGVLEHNPQWAGKIHETDIELETYDYFMAISKKSKYAGRITEINKIIADMKADGTMARLVSGGKAR